MKSLLIIAHGSRRASSNNEVSALRDQVAAATDVYAHVGYCFLELAQPDIQSGARTLVEQGTTELVVMPYFLVAGQHVVADIPAEIDQLRSAYPNVDIKLAPYFGSSPGVVSELIDQIHQAAQ